MNGMVMGRSYRVKNPRSDILWVQLYRTENSIWFYVGFPIDSLFSNTGISVSSKDHYGKMCATPLPVLIPPHRIVTVCRYLETGYSFTTGL